MLDDLIKTDLPTLQRVSQGKVRDMYEVGDDLLIITTDRISAFDVVMQEGIPDKGQILNKISLFWFDVFKDYTKNHVITAELDRMPDTVKRYDAQLRGRALLARKAEVFPVECVARGYLVGSGWKDYQATGKVCGIPLPAGLRQADKLAEPIFTPAHKAQTGHDENISFDEMANRIGADNAKLLRERTLEIYRRARDYAETRGILIADTKLEWGRYKGEVILIDEVLTPDSSRFWPKESYHPGANPPSFDKQYLRDYLDTLHWNKVPPAPVLPASLREETAAKYRQAYEILTGRIL